MSILTIIECIIIVFPAYFLVYKFSKFFLELEEREKQKDENKPFDKLQIDLILSLAEEAVRTEVKEYQRVNFPKYKKPTLSVEEYMNTNMSTAYPNHDYTIDTKISEMEHCIRFKYAALASSLIENTDSFDFVLPIIRRGS